MSRRVIKECLACKQPFLGRRDARTCSERCRKSLQRAKSLLSKEAEALAESAEKTLKSLESHLQPSFATEGGFVGSTAPTAPRTPSPPIRPQPSSISLSTPPPVESLEAISPTPPPLDIQGPALQTTPSVTSWPPSPALQQPQVLNAPPATYSPETFNPRPLNFNPVPARSSFIPSVSKRALLTVVSTGLVLLTITAAFRYLPSLLPSSPESLLSGQDIQEAISTSDTADTSLTSDLTNLSGTTISLNANTVVDVDSTTALVVQSAEGAGVLVVDTANKKVGINTQPNPTSAALQVVGDIAATGNINANGTLSVQGGIIATNLSAANLTTTGNLRATGSLSASGGTSTLSNDGLTINSVLVCTFQGCLVQDTSVDATTLQGRDTDFFLNSSNQNAGTLNDARLSANVALLNRTGQTFTGTNIFNATTTLNNTVLVKGDSSGLLQIQNAAGTTFFTANTSSGQILLPNATSTSQALVLGGDALLYRAAANVLKTDGQFRAIGTSTINAFRVDSVLGTDLAFGTVVGAEGSNRFRFNSDGRLEWGTGAGAQDTNLYRGSGGNRLRTDGAFTIQTTTNSTAAFQIQNSASGSLFTADTSGMNLTFNGENKGELSTWSTDANALPAARYNHASIAANGYVYVVGGLAGGNPQSTVYYAKLNANGSTGTWSTNTNALPETRGEHTSVTANGYIYVIGGWGGEFGNVKNTVYYAKLNADGSTGAWQTNTNALPAARFYHSSVMANGYVSVIGGFDGTTVQSTVYYAKLNADGSTGAWQTNTNALPAARYGHSSVAVNGYVYAIGGISTESTIYYAKLNADGTTNIWNTSTNALPSGRGDHSSVVSNGFVYTIGGNLVSTVYYASTSRIKIGGSLDLVSSVGLGGHNLAEGSSGGSLTAGNTQIVGTLQVQDNATFTQAVSIGGSLSVAGTSIALGSTNSGELNAWTTNINALPATRHQTEAIAANGYAYVIGGLAGSSTTSLIYYAKLNVDGLIGAWSTNANSLPAARAFHSSVTANGYAYVMGGLATCCITSSGQSTVYYAKLNADGSTGTWSTNSNALPAARHNQSSIVANGYIYVIGGVDNSGNRVSTTYYAKLNADGSTGSWSTNVNALPAARGDHTSVAANGYVYVIGGTNLGSGATTVYYAKLNADGSTGTWSTNANPLPQIRSSHTSVIANGYVYVIGGTNTSGDSPQSNALYAKLNADGSTGTWLTNITVFPATRMYHSSVIANGYVYVIGGSVDGTNGGAQSTVYYASTSRIKIGGSIDLVGASGGDLTVNNGGGGNLTAGNTQIVGTLQVQDNATFVQGVSIMGNLNIQSATGTLLLAADPGNLTITLGSASSTPVILVLGNKNTAGDPTCTNGGIYYNSSSTQFRGCANGAWNTLAGDNVVTSMPTTNLYDGRKVRLRVGTTPFGFVDLTYDSTYGKWVSAELAAKGTLTSGISVTATSATDLTHAQAGLTFIPNFKALYDAGLRLQGYAEGLITPGTTTIFAELAIQEFNDADTALTHLGNAASTSSGQAGAKYRLGVAWEQNAITAPLKTHALLRWRAYVDAGTGTINHLDAKVRWVSP